MSAEPIIIFAVGVLPLVIFVWAIVQIHGRHRTESPLLPMAGFLADGELKIAFCEDCGQRLIEWKRQEGFNRATGQPLYHVLLACPSWDQATAEAEYSAKIMSPIYSHMTSPRLEIRKTCGNRVRVETYTSEANTHIDDHLRLEGPGFRPFCPACRTDLAAHGLEIAG